MKIFQEKTILEIDIKTRPKDINFLDVTPQSMNC